MKKVFITSISFLAISVFAFAGTPDPNTVAATAPSNITFCTEVDRDGKPQFESNEFYIHNDGGFITILLRSGQPLNTSKVKFRIYKKDSAGNEVLQTELSQLVQPDWDFAWKEIIFYEKADYVVKAYNNNDQLIGTSKMKVNTVG